ncbi:LacI family DNA-binding transcriptional regulator [Zhouia sp. PK063]|uniref:LacI family DNA-binding transcriptional regulator n=1 Tax=Zhouia sp. PK063 TaxID=3373602 RepID=UPI0037AF501D
MKTKRHSIKDIASKLNVSVTTVSFVLNGKAKEKRISDEVTKKVLDYVKQINYKPNQLAQSLRTGESKIIVFMVEDISNYFFSKVARIIEDIAYEKGYKIIFCSNENEDEKSRELIQLFNERQVDGYIIIPSSGIKNEIEQLIEDEIPVVLFDRYFAGLNSNYVVIENYNASLKATNHLLEQGFKNIGFITTDVEQNQMLDRLKGYTEAIKEAGQHSLILKVPYKDKNTAKGEKLIKEFLQNENLDAVFFATNYLTQTGLAVVKKHFAFKINEWGIVTFDDNDFFDIYTPSITAISQPLQEMAEELMRIILAQLKEKNKELPFEKIVLSPKLNIRESSLRK